LISADALSVSDSSNWTAECWVYLSDNSSRQNFFLVADNGVTTGDQKDFQFEVSSTGKLTVRGGNGSTTYDISQSTDAVLHTWTHIAAVQNSGTITFYVNGESVGTDTITPASIGGTRPVFLFRNSAASSPMIDAYIADARIVVGTSVYTNAGIYDGTGRNVLETVGDAHVENSVKKYGTGSIQFDGTGDYLTIPASEQLAFGTGDFTIEGWINVPSIDATFRAIFLTGAPIQIYAKSGTVEIYVNDSDDTSTYIVNGTTGPASSITTNTWHHFAVVRNGTTFTVYVDGIAGTPATGVTAAVATSATAPSIGATISGTVPFTGYIDDFRITKGVARYTANFTPPAAKLPNL